MEDQEQKCLLCEDKKENHENCAHCSYDTRFCHMCNKVRVHATNYILGDEEFYKKLRIKGY